MRRTVAELGRLIGESPGLVAVRSQVEQLLRRQSGSRRLPPVLILGETGTGKGLLANAMHDAGPRAAGPFVAVNCAAIPETLLEAELFGFEQGAFTDARHAKAGLFQAANRGTLFLDEIGLLPASLQAKLLTVLEDRTVRRLGSTRSEPVDVWIISATSEDLKAGARRRGFREELYHRLAVVTLHLPALRERGSDILTLAEHYLARTCSEYGLPPKTLTEDARAALLAYRWPGNVRELANLMERVALLTDGRRVTADVLELGASRGRPASRPPDDDARPSRGAKATSLEHAVGEVERARIVEALQATGGNISHAAARLGVTRNILRYRLKKYGLQVQSETVDATGAAEPVSPMAAVELPPTPRTIHVQWERRHIALLRADLVPTPAVGAVSHGGAVLETLVEKVSTFGGQVEEVSPGGLVAVFGLEPIEDAPRRAAHAALAIQKAVAPDGDGSVEFPGVRTGLHVAEFLIAEVRGAVRLDHEAKREAWQQLEAIMGRAEAGTVLVSEPTRPFLARRFVLTACDVSRERAYRLEGLEQTGLGLGEQLTAFVGRRRELAQFADALDHARKGHGQVVAVVGEAGVGKSRLLLEFVNSPCVRDSLILISSAASYGKGMPYLPVINLLKSYFKIEPRDDKDRVKERIRERVLSLELASALPALFALLDVHNDDAPWSALDPSQKRERTLEAVKLLLLEESHVRPVIVVFEDLHWIDSETQAVLDTLIESLPSHRALLLASYRTEHQHTWNSKTYYAQLRIGPLSPDNAHALLDRLVGRDEATAALKRELIERTGGNPFFLEESVRTLVETGVLAGDRGAYRLALPAQGIRVPATVQAVLAARIDRLSPVDRTLLQTAAVIGKDVPFALLQAVADLPEEPLRAGLMRLRGSEFLYETRLVPELEYTFKHALSHEVAEGELLPERRRGLHARVVDAIETLHRDRLGEQIERLAHHAHEGDLREKAVDYLQQAGRKAAARSALPEAQGWFERALDVLKALPESPSTLEQAFEIRLGLRPVLSQLGEVRQMLERLREAETLAEVLNDDARRGRILAFMTTTHSLLDELDEAHASGTRALGIAARLGDLRLRILTTTLLEQVHYYRGEYARLVELATGNLATLPADWVYEYFGAPAPTSVFDRSWLVMSLAQLGRFTEAVEYETEAIRLAEPTQRGFPVSQAYRAAGDRHLLEGDWPKARSLYERQIAVAKTGNVALHLPWPIAASAWVLAQLGETSEALNRLREGEQLLERQAAKGIVFYRAWAYHALGRACLLLGRLTEAQTLGDRAVESAPRQLGFLAWALHLLGDIATHPDRFHAESGEAHYRKALALAEPRGMRPLVAHCHLGLGKLYQRTGKREQAQEHLAIATTMYREMDMRFWLEQAATKW
jgi:DNA-binding NtrC family response regulator/tetratricopeptide (TPR) repeat protein